MLNREQMIEEINQKLPDNIININWVNKVLEDMEHIKFHCDMRYCDWGKCKEEVKQSILKHIPDEIGLSRVLSALGKGYSYIVSFWEIKYETLDKTFYIARDINKSDWSDAMLNDQSDETIQSIYKILCK